MTISKSSYYGDASTFVDLHQQGAMASQTINPKLFELMATRVQNYAIFLIDTAGHIMSWNIGAEAIKGYAAAEIIGKHFSIFYTPPDIDRRWPDYELERAMREGRVEDEGWRIRKDGSRFWANVVITALRDDNGTLLAYSKITRDLSDRKATEERLRQSEERFRLLVDGVQDYAIYMLTPTGEVSSWNLGARRIKGYEASEIIGRHFSRFYSMDDIQAGKPWAELAIAREKGRAEEEGWRVRKDGSRFWARVVVTALYDLQERLYGFAKVTQDLTQRRHAESLQIAASNVNDFIAVLAHELRNPLAPIRNAAHILKMSEESKVKTSADIIDRQSGQLSRIVDDLLDVSRISRGSLIIETKPSDIAEIIQCALETARPNIEKGNHHIEIDLPSEPLKVTGDAARLSQALTNIINNAARYTPSGGNIFVRAFKAKNNGNSQACISVRDTGQGISPELLPSIFSMFVQGKDPLSRPSAGLGVGLALARSIVELHHGTIEAKSGGIGKGSEFVISLPLLSSVTHSIPESIRMPKNQVAVTEPVSRTRILVVDDNIDAALALTGLLKRHGHEVLSAYDGVEALQKFETFRPDFIFLDIGMPGMNGLEVARRIRERNPKPSPLIIAVTGWDKPEDRLRSQDAGFDMHLVKPVEETQLLEALGLNPRIIH